MKNIVTTITIIVLMAYFVGLTVYSVLVVGNLNVAKAYIEEADNTIAELNEVNHELNNREPLIETVIVPVEVEVPIIVEVPVEVTVELKQFESVNELRYWLGSEGKYSMLLPSGQRAMCWHYAFSLQDRARLDGYDIYIQTVYPNIYNAYFMLMSISTPHVVNATIINGDIYFIEPQTNEIAHVGYLVNWSD